jgi:hypothetical protein
MLNRKDVSHKKVWLDARLRFERYPGYHALCSFYHLDFSGSVGRADILKYHAKL